MRWPARSNRGGLPGGEKEHLARNGVVFRGRSFVGRIGNGSVTVGSLDGGADVEGPAVAVVHVTFHEPNLELATQLGAEIGELIGSIHVVGEARTQRFLTDAIREGHEAGRSA